MELTKIPLEGLSNTRDLGGFLAAGGKRIRPRKLLRSGNLYKATKKDLQILTDEYHLSAIIDFRTEEEQSQMPDPPIPGVLHISNPILGAAPWASPGKAAPQRRCWPFY